MISVDSMEAGLLLKVETGQLDAGNADAIKAAVKDRSLPKVSEMTVDLGPVEFIDSSGVGLLLSFYKQLVTEDGSVMLTNVQPTVVSVLELLRLNRIFLIQAS